MKHLTLCVVIVLSIFAIPLSGWTASAVQFTGAGLIGQPIAGKTINSTSDVGFAVTPENGTFLCSMAGPLTGGFKGLAVMTVEGPVTKGSLKVRDSMMSGSSARSRTFQTRC